MAASSVTMVSVTKVVTMVTFRSLLVTTMMGSREACMKGGYINSAGVSVPLAQVTIATTNYSNHSNHSNH